MTIAKAGALLAAATIHARRRPLPARSHRHHDVAAYGMAAGPGQIHTGERACPATRRRSYHGSATLAVCSWDPFDKSTTPGNG
jgi:hypothetical protein